MSKKPILLVVDDETDFKLFVDEAASEMGFETRTAGGGKEARREYFNQVPDIVILDLIMPDEDGIETLNWLVEQGYTGKVIFVTGFNPVYAEVAERIGEVHGVEVIGSLKKPIRLGTLQETLSPFLT